ncbi:MAG TPA: hypothetical protein VF816_11235 [Rhodocyclaceae bacterium]
MATEYEMTFNDYLEIVKRRALHLALAFLTIFGISVVVAIAYPPIYQSKGTILIESQQIPTDLVQASVTTYADERIEIIRQRVMTRENLLKIIDKYNLYADKSGSATVSDKIDQLRAAIEISIVNAEVKGKNQAAIAFSLGFEHRQPEVASKVANDLVTLFLDENVKQRTQRATETTAFLTKEADKLKVELEKVEGQLAAYKQEHGTALPDSEALRLTQMSRIEDDLREVQRDLRSAQEERRSLDTELAAARAGGSSKSGAAGPQDLGSLKAEYERLSNVYTQAHPDVRTLKRKIDALEAAAKNGTAGPTDAGGPVSLEVARVQTRIAAANARIEADTAQERQLRGRLASYERDTLRAPQVERGLVELTRDHENARKKYEEIRAKQMSAQISENLEEENKAERLVLIDPPVMPDKPIKPNRIKMIAMGFVFAVGGAGGLITALETINQRVRGTEALTAVIRQRVLVSIPYIETQAETIGRKAKIKRALKIAAVAVIVVLLGLQLFYMPLDLLFIKILARLNLG